MSRGRFVDAKGVEHDLSSPNFEGWLTKQSAWLKDWRRRFNAITRLYYGLMRTDILFLRDRCSFLQRMNMPRLME